MGDEVAFDEYYAKWSLSSQKTDQEIEDEVLESRFSSWEHKQIEREKEIMSDLFITHRVVKSHR